LYIKLRAKVSELRSRDAGQPCGEADGGGGEAGEETAAPCWLNRYGFLADYLLRSS
jgi:hypothetical protein